MFPSTLEKFMEIAPIIVFVGTLIFLAHLFAAIFARTRIPDVLFLIVIGIILGPVIGIITPEDFGKVGGVFTTITLVVILFEGGLSLRVDTLRAAIRGTMALANLGFVVTMTSVGFAAWLLTPLDLLSSLMLGAILGGTSSIIVIPLVRQLRMMNESRTILFLESCLTDVLCIVVAFAFLEAIKLGELRFGLMIGHMLSTFTLAIILGVVGGLVWSILLHRVRTLKNAIFTTPAFVFVVFGIVELLGYSGAIAALALGITLGNIELFKKIPSKKYTPVEPIALNETEKVFFSEVGFLLKTFFFVYIGMSIRLTDVWWVSIGLVLTLVVFALRIPVVRYSTNRALPRRDASIMAVMAPKGLAPAVLASIPLQQGIPGGELIQNVTYAVVFFSIVVNSVLVFLLDRTPLGAIYDGFFGEFVRTSELVPVDEVTDRHDG
jgi:cell volume regulation protein A